jgi:hypothetical protein
LYVPTKKTTAHRSPWSKEDIKELKAHSKARTPVAKVAKTMKRTEGALRRKAGILGIGLGTIGSFSKAASTEPRSALSVAAAVLIDPIAVMSFRRA